MRGASRPGLLVVLALVILAGIGLMLRRVSSERAAARRPPAAVAEAAPKAPAVPGARRTPTWRADLDDEPSEDQAYKSDPLSPDVDTAEAWARVDFDEIRAAMPDSLYWKMAFPTKDPAIIAERERIRAEWSAQYAKIQSNTATDEEIDAYYAAQQQLSSDYLEFLVHLAQHYGDVVPRAEIGALKLAGEMHLAKLEEMPRRIAEAKERHAAHEKAREAWLAEQKDFASEPPAAQ